MSKGMGLGELRTVSRFTALSDMLTSVVLPLQACAVPQAVPSCLSRACMTQPAQAVLHAALSTNQSDSRGSALQAPASVVMVREGDAFVTFYPEKAQRVTCGIDHIGEAMIIGKQWMSWAPAEDEPYRWSLSPARSYYTHPQVHSG